MERTEKKLINGLKVGVCAVALFAGMAMVSPSYAADQKVTEKVEAEVKQDTQKQIAKKRKEITKEALTALQETSNALKALDEGKTKDALASLEKATGKLQILLAREPGLAFAPVNVSSDVQDIVTSVEHAQGIVKTAQNLLDDGKVQEARVLLSTLVSEMNITITSLPMVAYPVALAEAAALIDDGKVEEAKDVLQVALNTLTFETVTIPLPVANAEGYLAEAKKLAETKNRTDEQNRDLSRLLSAAEREIKFAEVLGYGSKKDFKGFFKEIESIREKTSDGKSGKGFFNKITGYLSSMTEDSQTEDKQ